MPTPGNPSPPLKKSTCPCVVVKKFLSFSSPSFCNEECVKRSIIEFRNAMLKTFVIPDALQIFARHMQFGKTMAHIIRCRWQRVISHLIGKQSMNTCAPQTLLQRCLKLRHSCLHFLWHNVITSAHWIEPSASTVATLWDFFSHTLSAESHAGPQKKIKGRKTVFILARHQICTAHEKSKNQYHRPGSRLGMVESGSGSVRSWPRGGRAPSPLVALSVGMGSSDDAKACMPACVKMADHREMRAVTVACRRCRGLTVLWFVPTIGGTVLPPRSISHRLPSPGPPNGTVPTPPIPGRCVLLFVVQRAKLSLRTCPLSAMVRLHLWGGRLGLCPPPIGNPAIGGAKIRPTYSPPTDPICCRAEHRPEVAQYKPNKIVNCQTKPPTWPWNDAG